MGLGNIRKVLSRDSMIKNNYTNELMYYIWFIGVDPDSQKKGKGSELLTNLIGDSFLKKRRIFLETSMEENVPWYKKHGLEVYKILVFTHNLYMLKMKQLDSRHL
jgi:ribosomal protein S18 acetylase RimI-like enzyme